MARPSAPSLTSARGRRAAAGIAALCLVALVSACEQESADVRAEGRYGGTLVIGGPNDLRGMNPLVTAETYTQEFNRFVVYLPLVQLTPELDYEPALAREWETEGDTAVVFHLRDDVRWHDGRPVTAYDVLFTFELAKNPEVAFPNPEWVGQWNSAQVVDSFTIRFSITPHPDPLYGWTQLPPVPRHLLDSIPPAQLRNAEFNRAPVGNGPFRFVSYRANDQWAFEANPDFPEDLGGRPYLDRIVWRVIPENSAQITELIAGNADVIMSPRAEQVRELDPRPDIRAIIRPSPNYFFIGWNTRLPQFADARVRRALAMAIDRQAIIDGLRGGWGEVAAGPVPSFHWAFPDDVEPLPHDTAAARRLLAEAGWTNRDQDPALEDASGQEFEFAMMIPAGNEFNRDVAELIRGDLAGIGVRMSTRATEFGTLVAAISSPERNFEAVQLGLTTDFRLNLRNQFHSESLDGDFQLASYSNPEVDRLIDSTAVTMDRDRARPMWARLQQIMRDEQPWTFMYYYPDLRLIRERVRGADMDIRGSFATISTWWIDETADTTPQPQALLE